MIHSLRECLIRNKIFFEIFFFSVITLILGILTYLIAKEQLIISQFEHSPFFKIEEIYSRDTTEGRRMTHYIDYYNEGSPCQNIKINPMAFFDITLYNYKEDKESIHIIPLHAYFGIGRYNQNIIGYIAEYSTINNYYNLYKVRSEIINYNKHSDKYSISSPISIITEISYSNYKNKQVTEYYLDNHNYSHTKVPYNIVKPYIEKYNSTSSYNYMDVNLNFILEKLPIR